MRLQILDRRSGALLRRFSADRRGNIVVMGAVLMLPLTLLAGGASDYARAREVRSALQDRLDAAVLGGVKGSDPVAAAGAAFEAPTSAGVTFAAPSFVLTPAGLLEGDASASVPAAFLGLAGIETFTVRAQASAGLKRMPTDVCLTAVNTTGPGLTRRGRATSMPPIADLKSALPPPPAASFGGNGGSVTASDVCVRGATVFATRHLHCAPAVRSKMRPACNRPPRRSVRVRMRRT
jgi:Flp pilus assembly protein TadG